jgi:transcriptional regulator with PAS, ATPase and Fis domain
MYSIKIPPLKERKSDILPLVRHFLTKHAAETRKKITAIDPALRDFFLNYSFPGNIRELNNIIASAVLAENSDVLTFGSASAFLPRMESVAEPVENGFLSLADMEKQHIVRILKATGGNRKEAAKILGVNPTTVYRKIEKYGITD